MRDSKSKKWIEVMNAELQSMKENELWDLVDLPPGSKIVVCKWVFKKKTNMDGKINKFKATLVARLYS